MAETKVAQKPTPTPSPAPAPVPAPAPSPAPTSAIPWKLILAGIGGAGLIALVLKKAKPGEAKVGDMVFTDQKKDLFIRSIPSAARPYAEDVLTAADEFGVSPFLILGFMEHESAFGMRLKPPGAAGFGDPWPRKYNPYWKQIGLAVKDVGLVTVNDKTFQGYMPADFAGWGLGLMQNDLVYNLAWAKTGAWKDPLENIRNAMRILKGKMSFFQRTPTAVERAEGDPRPLTGNALLQAAISAYNTGEGNVLNSLKKGLSPDITTWTKDYSQRIMASWSKMQGDFESTAGKIA